METRPQHDRDTQAVLGAGTTGETMKGYECGGCVQPAETPQEGTETAGSPGGQGSRGLVQAWFRKDFRESQDEGGQGATGRTGWGTRWEGGVRPPQKHDDTTHPLHLKHLWLGSLFTPRRARPTCGRVARAPGSGRGPFTGYTTHSDLGDAAALRSLS